MRWSFEISGQFIDADTAQESDIRLHEAVREFIGHLEREFGHLGAARYTGPAVGVWDRSTDGSGTSAEAVPFTAPEQSSNEPHQNYIEDVAFDDSTDDGDGVSDPDGPPADTTEGHLA